MEKRYRVVVIIILSIFVHARVFCAAAAAAASTTTPVTLPTPHSITIPTCTPRGLLIFLDDSEEFIAAISKDFVIALTQKAGPLIASASLVRNIFAPFAEIHTNQLLVLIKAAWALKATEADPTNVDAQNALKLALLKTSGFDPSAWTIKKINDDLFLFIPDHHLEHLRVPKTSVTAMSREERISPTELKLGLKVNHMETTTIEEILRVTEPAPRAEATSSEGEPEPATYGHYFIEALDSPESHRSTLFCTRYDYLHQPHEGEQVLMPTWSLYLSGHGATGKMVAWLGIDDFKKLLDFCEQKITTRFFYYTTCDAGGLNMEAVYKHKASLGSTSESTAHEEGSITTTSIDHAVPHAFQKKYSFAIAMEAATDAKTMSDSVKPESFKISWLFGSPVKLDLTQQPHFDVFLRYATEEHLNYEKIVTTFCPTTPTKDTDVWGTKVSWWGNIPQIKRPNSERFVYVASKSDVVTLGPIIAQAHDPSKPLDICSYFKANPKALLLDTPVIPYELSFNAPSSLSRPTSNPLRMKSIISILPGDMTHAIKKVSSRAESTHQIMNWLMNARIDYAHRKTFIIGEIQGTDRRLTNVVISYIKNHGDLFNELTSYALFTEGDKRYFQERDKKPELVTTQHFGTVSSADVLEALKKSKKVTIAELLSRIIFASATIPAETSINNALSYLKDSSEQYSCMVHIKTVSGCYFHYPSNPFLEIPGVKDLEHITLTDLIIDNQQNSIYYTYKGDRYCGKNKIDENYVENFMQDKPLQDPFKEKPDRSSPLSAVTSHETRKNALLRRDTEERRTSAYQARLARLLAPALEATTPTPETAPPHEDSVLDSAHDKAD